MDLIDIQNNLKKIFHNDSSGHDYWHTSRVYKNAMKIASIEGGDTELIALAALLHDVDDSKLFSTSDYENARRIMHEKGISQNRQNEVIKIIKEVSFRGIESITPKTLEGKIVQDADRLDAIGAIGIARTFAYGGSRGRAIYDPDILPIMNMDANDYLEADGTSINHFYEKLFVLKGMMNTETARKEAERRDLYMHDFLEQFLYEWNQNC